MRVSIREYCRHQNVTMRWKEVRIELKVPPSGCLYIVSGDRSWKTDSVDQCGGSERGFEISHASESTAFASLP
jgi:hypothetical protein